MPRKSSDDLTREGEPSQKTEHGMEIPVPTRDELFSVLDRAIRKSEEPSARPSEGKRRPSRGW
jgi:hypothetical protein